MQKAHDVMITTEEFFSERMSYETKNSFATIVEVEICRVTSTELLLFFILSRNLMSISIRTYRCTYDIIILAAYEQAYPRGIIEEVQSVKSWKIETHEAFESVIQEVFNEDSTDVPHFGRIDEETNNRSKAERRTPCGHTAQPDKPPSMFE